MPSESIHDEECNARHNIETAWYERYDALKQIFNGKSKAIMYPHIAEQYAMIKRGEYVRNECADLLILKTHGTCIRKPRTSRSALHKLDMHALFTIFTYVWTACDVWDIYDKLYEKRMQKYVQKIAVSSYNKTIITNCNKFEVLFCDMKFAEKSYRKCYGPRNFSVANRGDDFQPCDGWHIASITYNFTCYVLNTGVRQHNKIHVKIPNDKEYERIEDGNKFYMEIIHKTQITEDRYIRCCKIEKYVTPLCINRYCNKYFDTYVEYDVWAKLAATSPESL